MSTHYTYLMHINTHIYIYYICVFIHLYKNIYICTYTHTHTPIKTFSNLSQNVQNQPHLSSEPEDHTQQGK